MGSVQTMIECPRCKVEDCMEDYYYKSNEVYLFCHNCGYNKSVTIKRNEEGKLVPDEKGNPIWETKEEEGAGIVSIGEGCVAVYTIPIDLKERKLFLSQVEEYKEKNPTAKVDIRPYKKEKK